jgi:hypothetical protein
MPLDGVPRRQAIKPAGEQSAEVLPTLRAGAFIIANDWR